MGRVMMKSLPHGIGSSQAGTLEHPLIVRILWSIEAHRTFDNKNLLIHQQSHNYASWSVVKK